MDLNQKKCCRKRVVWTDGMFKQWGCNFHVMLQKVVVFPMGCPNKRICSTCFEVFFNVPVIRWSPQSVLRQRPLTPTATRTDSYCSSKPLMALLRPRASAIWPNPHGFCTISTGMAYCSIDRFLGPCAIQLKSPEFASCFTENVFRMPQM